MKDITVALDDRQYASMLGAAEAKGGSISDLAHEILCNWISKMEESKSSNEAELKNRFYKLRVKGLEPSRIAEEIGVTRAAVSTWDEEVRQSSKVWGKAFYYLRKSTDPLTWEMKVMDAFYEIWGSKPPA